jgi:tetratricopeptide (TPR) repeat protein
MKKSRPRTETGRNEFHAAGVGRSAVSLAAPVLVALFSLVAFLPALGNQFVNWDDYETLVDNPRYRGLSPSHLGWMFTTFHMGHYQPLSWLTFALDYLVWGTDPFGYHLTNLILHAANAVSFFYLARLLLARALPVVDGAAWRLALGAALAALFFSLHPLRVESVVWATERRDVLSGLFYFLALYAYVRVATADQDRVRRLTLSVLFYALSLLAKGTAMTLPVVLLLLDVYPLRRLPGTLSAWGKPDYRPIFWEKLPYFALAGVFAVVALLAQQVTGALRPVEQYFISYRLGQVSYAPYFYLWKTLVPVELSPLYELPYDFDAWMPFFYLCGLAALAMTAVFYFLRHRWPALLASWLYYLVLLAPVAGLAQSGPQLVADRYSYLSCLSWALLLGGGIHYLLFSDGGGKIHRVKRYGTASAAVVALVALGWMSWQQSKVWRDTTTLWRRVIAVAPQSSIAYFNLGRMHEDQGNFAEGLAHYRRALEINPLNADAHYNLARLLAKRGERDEAITHYREALKIRPKDADAHNNLGLLLAARGETAAALGEFQQALRLNPKNAKAFVNQGRVLAQQNDLDQAVQSYRQALAISPNEVEILVVLADALAKQEQFAEAVVHLEKALALRPELSDLHVALARSLAAQGKKEQAERHYQEALRLLKAKHQSALSGAMGP